MSTVLNGKFFTFRNGYTSMIKCFIAVLYFKQFYGGKITSQKDRNFYGSSLTGGKDKTIFEEIIM